MSNTQTLEMILALESIAATLERIAFALEGIYQVERNK